MKGHRLFSFALSGALIFGAPSGAQAQGYAPPVSINTCATMTRPNAVPSNAPTFMGVPIASMVSQSTGMHIAFVNNSSKVAKLVNFEVESNGNQFVVRDVGTFSPGVLIDHQFDNGAGQSFFLPAFIAPNVKCRVASVEFADGTIWRHGDRPAAAPVANNPYNPSNAYGGGHLSVSPPSLVIDEQSEAGLLYVETSSRVAALRETDNCRGIAEVFVSAVADGAASYYVRPLSSGRCTAHIIDENGARVSVPITVR